MARTSWARPIPFAATLFFLSATAAVLLFTSRFHEFWRDELQAALIARAVPLSSLISVMRTEGVPALYYLALKALLGLPPPYSLSVMAAIGYASLLFGTYRLLLGVSGSRGRALAVTAALAVTDTYFYELGVVVRQYGLGLGFALACVAYLAKALDGGAKREARWGALFGALAASTALHPACLAGAALLTYSVLRLAHRPTLRAVLEPLFALPAFLFTFFIIGPYDRAPAGLAVRHPALADAMEIAGRVLADGLVCRGWWTDWRQVYAIDGPRMVAMAGVVLALLVLLALRSGELRRASTVATFYSVTLVLNAATLFYVFVVRYEGSYRHHLFLVVPVLLLGLGLLVGRRPARETQGVRRAAFVSVCCLVAPWFLYQYCVLARDVMGDGREALGSAKGASEVFPRGARVVIAGEDWMAAGVVYYRPDIALRATSSLGRPIRYQILDWHWPDVVPLTPMLEEECTKAAGASIYVIARGAAPESIAPCTRFLAAPPSHLPTEQFRIFELSCSCPELAASP